VFRVTYKNGVNAHEVTTPLPLPLESSKKRAEPVTSNIKVEPEADFIR